MIRILNLSCLIAISALFNNCSLEDPDELNILVNAVVDVTFRVDMSETIIEEEEGIYLFGDFQETPWQAGEIKLSNTSDDIWEITLALPAHRTYKYRFSKGPDASSAEELSLECDTEDNFNREFSTNDEDVVLNLVCFGECEPCVWACGDIWRDSRDGKKYPTTSLNGLCWMTENLAYDAGTSSFCYTDNLSNCNDFGRMYSALNAKNVTPPEWRLPFADEWEALLLFYGFSISHTTVGTKYSGNVSVFNPGGVSGLEILYGGVYGNTAIQGQAPDYNYFGMGTETAFWIDSDTSLNQLLSVEFRQNSMLIPNTPNVYQYVRCVKE